MFICVQLWFSFSPCSADVPPPPDWARDAVWYQIFPERFRNGDPSNDPSRESLEWPIQPSEKWRIADWTADWYARSDWEKEIGPNFYSDGVLDRRYGGDLQGVLERLDYLADLGITAIYFNPLFSSRSLHKYDGNTFHHIDPVFGPDPRGDLALMEKETGLDPTTWTWTSADQLFLKLLGEARRRGIRVILDGVFNHTGRDFFAYRDLRKNQERSAYRDWYLVESFDDPRTRRDEFDVNGWWGFKTLPVFAASPDGNDLAAGPKAYVFAATKRWLDPNGDGDPRDGIDGWRLDVAPERPAKFWADWHAHVRRINPAAYTSCEIWTDASALIRDGHFSACMNYHAFAIPTKGFLIDARITASQFAKLLEDRRAALPAWAVPVMQNLMGSHDTDRLASMCSNADIPRYSGPAHIEFNPNGITGPRDDYDITRPTERERAIQRLVVLFQMTYPGAPMLYYGDEAGMWGSNDPDDRLPMTWPELQFAPQAIDPRGRPRTPDPVGFERELFDFYKKAIALRREHAALRRGDFRIVAADDAAQTFAFTRSHEGKSAVVIFNRSERQQTVRLAWPGAATATVAFVTDGTTEGLQRDGENLSLPPLTGAVMR